MDINTYIPSFGEFMVQCKECDIDKDLFTTILFEFLNNPKKYNKPEIIKNYLSENLPINSYIQIVSKLNL